MDVHITHKDKIISHQNTLGNLVDRVCADYEILILLDDLHVEKEAKHISEFSMYNLKSIKSFMCRSGSNCPWSFQKRNVFETEVFQFLQTYSQNH